MIWTVTAGMGIVLRRRIEQGLRKLFAAKPIDFALVDVKLIDRGTGGMDCLFHQPAEVFGRF